MFWPAVPVKSPIEMIAEEFSTMISLSVAVALSLPDAAIPLRFCTLMFFFAVSVTWLSPIMLDVPIVPAITLTFAGSVPASLFRMISPF